MHWKFVFMAVSKLFFCRKHKIVRGPTPISVIQLSGAEKKLYEIIIERSTQCLSFMLISCLIKNTFLPFPIIARLNHM